MTSTRVALAKEIDVATAPALREQLYAAIEANPGETVVADLSPVQFLDSTGLGVLVAAMKHARSSGGDLRLTKPADHVWKVFAITGLDRVFELES
jgi:anti-sigma B factor antagonist